MLKEADGTLGNGVRGTPAAPGRLRRARRTAWVCLVAAACHPAPSAAASAGQRKAETVAEGKLEGRLLSALDLVRAGAPPPSTGRRALDVDAQSRVLLDITADVTSELLDEIEAGGGVIITVLPQHDAIRARMGLEDLIVLAERDDVRIVRPAEEAITNRPTRAGDPPARRGG